MIYKIQQKKKTSNNDQLLIESLAHRINSLEEIAGFQAIILQSLLSKLDEKGVVTKEDVRVSLAEIDELDGVKDGKLNINTLLFLLQ